MDFDMFFEIIIFDPKWGSRMGYSLCMMADFQNGPISRIFVFFSSGFLHRTTLNDFKNGFWPVFWNFNFWPKLRILHGLYIAFASGERWRTSGFLAFCAHSVFEKMQEKSLKTPRNALFCNWETLENIGKQPVYRTLTARWT